MPIQLDPFYIDEEPLPDTNAPALGAVTQDEGVSLSTGPAPQQLPDPIAERRSQKIHEGLGEVLQKDKTQIKTDLNNGDEKHLRTEAAAKIDANNSKVFQQHLIDIANTTPEMSMDQLDAELYRQPKRTDPETVVEKAYAKAAVDNPIESAVLSLHESPVARAKLEVSEAFDRIKDNGVAAQSRIEYAGTIREGLELQIKEQAWTPYLQDQVKNLFQPYVEVKSRKLNERVGAFSGGILLGTNLQEQADNLLSPVTTPTFEEYKTKLKNITDTLAKDNVILAHRFAEYVEGVATTDRVLDNTFTLMGIPDWLGITKIGSAVIRKIVLANRTTTAVKKLVQDSATIEARIADGVPPAAARAESLGDAGTAATERSAKIIEDTIAGKVDPIEVATKDSLTTNLLQDGEMVLQNRGELSREQTVRIQDAFKAAAESIIEKITTATRINRIPLPVATQNAVRVIKEAVKDYYPGIRNAILDISNPMYEQRSNTYWHEITFGNFGGDLFSNPKTAKNFMEIHGIDGEIVEGYGKVTPAQTEKWLDRQTVLRKNIRDAEDAITANKARAKDKKLSIEDQRKAIEQYEGLAGHKKDFEKELSEIDLNLRGQKTVERVKTLDAETVALRSENKEARRQLKAKHTTEDDKTIINKAVEQNEARIAANLAESGAIRNNRASVIGSLNTVEQHGVGYKIVIRRPLVETDKSVRDLMIRDVDGKLVPQATSLNSEQGTLRSLFNGALNIAKYRTSEDTLSLNESIQRTIGTYSQSLFKEWAAEEIKYIADLAKGRVRVDPVTNEDIPAWKSWTKSKIYNNENQRKVFNEWSRTVDYARTAPDPISGKPGYFFQTPGEVQNHYRTFFDRSATFAEQEAYFAYVRLVEGDRIFREISEFRNRARLGTEQHLISMRGPDGKILESGYFDGVTRKTFPGGDDVMLILGRRAGDEKTINLGGAAVPSKTLEGWRKDVLEGRKKVIEIYAPEHTPLREFSDIAGNEHVRYVLVDNVKSKSIDFNHVNRRGGGHFEYDYDHYIKQASMYHQYEQNAGIKGRYRSVYTGDTVFMPVDNRVMGADIAAKMNKGRELLRSGDIDAARAHVEDTLPIEFEKFEKMFAKGRDENGKVLNSQYDINEPFMVVPNGKTVADMGSGLQERYGNAFKDGTRSGSLNKQFSTAFNTERDSEGLRTFVNDGSSANPTYKYATAELVDPIETMSRALSRITSSVFMDDYKLYAIEHWLREAEPHLTKINYDLARSAPFFVFKSAENKAAFAAATPNSVVNNLLANRFKINQFIGIPSKIDNAIGEARDFLTDALYRRNLSDSKLASIPLWAIDHSTDPVTAMRYIVSHEKLGLFNPVQFAVQAQTYTNISAIAPRSAGSGVLGAFLHVASAIKSDDAFLKYLDKLASKMQIPGMKNWKPGEFYEARKTLENTGFKNVAGEYADMSGTMKSDMILNEGKALANAGLIFFKSGEKTTRLGAWYTAFKEFRHDFPTKALTRDDIGTILKRADLLTSNMSRASASGLNQGIFSLPTQFLTYSLRQTELFTGRRLGDTPLERNMARGRLLLFNALLYGAPVGVGVAGLPFVESIRKEAIQRGYVIGENWYKTMAMEGLPAWFIGHMTGDWQRMPNIGARFGSPGLTQFRDALKSDKVWYQLLAGAAGTSLANTLGALSPFWKGVTNMLEPDNSKKTWPLKLDDLLGIFKEASVINQGWKFAMALSGGKWMSKNEQEITDVSKAQAAFFSVTGTQPQKQDDAYLKASIKKDEVDMQKSMLRDFIKEYHRYLDASKANDPNGAKDYFKRADSILELGGYPTTKRAAALQIAVSSYKGQIEDSDFKFFTEDVPPIRKDFMGIPTPFVTQSDVPNTRREQFRTETQLDRTK